MFTAEQIDRLLTDLEKQAAEADIRETPHFVLIKYIYDRLIAIPSIDADLAGKIVSIIKIDINKDAWQKFDSQCYRMADVFIKYTARAWNALSQYSYYGPKDKASMLLGMISSSDSSITLNV